MSTDKSVNTQSSSFEDDDFLGAEIEVHDQSFGPQYATCTWMNGSPKNKKVGGIAYTGGFFIGADAGVSVDELKAAGFEATSVLTSTGDEIHGFSKSSLKFAPIRTRRCWQVQAQGNSFPQRYANDEYDAATEVGKPRGVTHLLVAIEGISEPVLLSFRGMNSKEVMGQGKDRGIIPLFSQRVIGAAKKAAKATNRPLDYPLCAFTLEISYDRVDPKKDDPKFTEVGSEKKNMITKPVWVDAPSAEVQLSNSDLKSRFVGNANLAKYQDWHRSADEWVAAWEGTSLQSFRNRRSGGSASTASDGSGAVGDNEVGF